MLKILVELYGLDEAFRQYERILEARIKRARRAAALRAAMQKRLDNAWRCRIVSSQTTARRHYGG